MVNRVEHLQKQMHERRPTATRLAKEADELAAERTAVEEQARTERDEAVRLETDRRRAPNGTPQLPPLPSSRNKAEAERQNRLP